MKTTKSKSTGLLALLAGGAALTATAIGATLAYSLTGNANNERLGASLVALGDLNGDGISDFAAGDPEFNVPGSTPFSASGQVVVISGKDGSTLFRLRGTPAADQHFGVSLAAIQANGDGKLDVVVGATGGSGAVWIYSGANGSLIRKITAPSPGAGSHFGHAIANAGDQNGDGKDDLFVGSPHASTDDGRVAVISGANGTLITELSPLAADGEFGASLASIPDRNSDGKRDLVVGSPAFSAGLGRVQILASTSGVEINFRLGVVASARLGETVAAVDDRNSDGKVDIVAGSGSGGSAFLLSGADLSVITDLSLAGAAAGLPVVPGGILDVDRDGDTELLIGYPGAAPVARVDIIPAPTAPEPNVYDAATAGTGLGSAVAVIPGLGFAIGEPLSEGGAVHVYTTLKDTDGDGVPDFLDECKRSILTKTVKLGNRDSGVKNIVLDDGCSLADLFAHLKPRNGWKNHGQFVSKAGKLIKELRDDDVIGKGEAKDLHQAAAQSNIGKTKKNKDND